MKQEDLVVQQIAFSGSTALCVGRPAVLCIENHLAAANHFVFVNTRNGVKALCLLYIAPTLATIKEWWHH